MTKPQPIRRLLRIPDAAVYLGMGTKKLRRLIREGVIPRVEQDDERSPWLVDIHDLDEWITKNKR